MIINNRELSRVHSDSLKYLQRPNHCAMSTATPADEAATAAGDLKGGHAPAVKVGGMRVVQHKKEGEKPEGTQMTPEEEEEFGASPPKTDKHNSSLLVSGVVTKGDKDFTAQAVKSFHDKPMPTHDPKPRPVQNTHQIHQPR